MIEEETQPLQPRFIAQWCEVKFNRESKRRLRLNWQCIDYDYISFLVSWIDYDYSKNCNQLRLTIPHVCCTYLHFSIKTPRVMKLNLIAKCFTVAAVIVKCV